MSERSEGFTLIEMMVVMIIISLLAVALIPAIGGIMGQSEAAATQARIELLRAMINKYNNREGEYPPSDFAQALKGVKVKADGTNMGIECLVIHLHQKNLGANFSLEDKLDWLMNTDEDDNGAEIPMLRTTKKYEVVDAWYNPIVYFRAGSYRRSQEVTLSDGEGGNQGPTVTVNAMKGDKDYVSPRGYQLISAGEDAEFGTDDDICYPPKVLK